MNWYLIVIVNKPEKSIECRIETANVMPSRVSMPETETTIFPFSSEEDAETAFKLFCGLMDYVKK